MKKELQVFGNQPEAIQSAPVVVLPHVFSYDFRCSVVWGLVSVKYTTITAPNRKKELHPKYLQGYFSANLPNPKLAFLSECGHPFKFLKSLWGSCQNGLICH